MLAGASHAELLTLSQAEHAAITTGFEARSQHYYERAKEWEKWNAVANYLPSIDYNLTYLHIDQESVNAAEATAQAMQQMAEALAALDTANASGPTTRSEAEQAQDPFAVYGDSWKHEFTLNQPITNGGVEIVAIGIARHTKRAIEYEQDAARQRAIYDTRKAYFDALTAQQFTAVAEQALDWTRRNLGKARVRNELGSAPVTDVLQWEADLAAREGDLLQARAAQRTALLILHQTMGVTIDNADTAVELAPLEIYEAWYNKGPTSVAGTVEQNPTLLAVREYAQVAKGATRVSVTRMLPKINAFLNYGWPAWEKFALPEPADESRTYSLGVVASVPLFSGFRNATNYRKTKYEQMQALVDEQKLANQLAVNLDRIASFYRASYQKVAAARGQRDLMRRQLEIMQQRYDSGLVNQSQLLEVELGARQAHLGYISALLDCLLLEAEYRMNVGNLEVAS